ncbi:hypothetical protein Indivirus_1_62 [Indivirus ILV1]|uniref:XRN2-binding (XTBD) domain-containing protein n=1 Tax=Indivirus ILV1 TaxID=1977633 RepID=A0A1V0SCK0_9VIRU|nr:hypothetical protein Indivirus_1_62 [Indivirus ILV1]
MSVFRKNNRIYIVHKDPFESYEHFIMRGNFIASQEPSNDQEYENIKLYSYIYINNKFLKCSYKSEIMDKLEAMVAKCKTN